MSSAKDVAKTMIFHIKLAQLVTPNLIHIRTTHLLQTFKRLGYSRSDYLDGWQFMLQNKWAVKDGLLFILTDLGRLQSP